MILQITRCSHLTGRKWYKGNTVFTTYNSYFTSLFWHVVIKYGLIWPNQILPFFQVFSRFSRSNQELHQNIPFPWRRGKRRFRSSCNSFLRVDPQLPPMNWVETLDTDTPDTPFKGGRSCVMLFMCCFFYGLNGIEGQLKTWHWWREFEIAWCERLMLKLTHSQ